MNCFNTSLTYKMGISKRQLALSDLQIQLPLNSDNAKEDEDLVFSNLVCRRHFFQPGEILSSLNC